MYRPNRIWMRLCLLFIIAAVFSLNIHSQKALESYSDKTKNINKRGMYSLGSWAALNMGLGAYYWSKSQGEKKYFNQMNFWWNTVNLGLAGIGLFNQYSTSRNSFTAAELLKSNKRTERIFLINSGLDLLYIGSGIFLYDHAKKVSDNQERLAGYGRSLILQGGFLLIFDAIMYGLLKYQRNIYYSKQNVQISTGNNGIGIYFNF